MATPQNEVKRGLVGRIWGWVKRVGPWTVVGLFAAGIVFWGGFNWALELTNTESFCISCHEMEDNVFKEYRSTIHYTNRTGVRATCPDCHVPHEWRHKIVRKIRASNELWHKMLGSINTREKFNAKRLELAQHEWNRMKATDSRECRNCHAYNYMDYAAQAGFLGGQDLHRLPQGHRAFAPAHRSADRRAEGERCDELVVSVRRRCNACVAHPPRQRARAERKKSPAQCGAE